MRSIIFTIFMSLAYLASAQIDGSTTVYTSGFSSPISLTHAGDDRLFVNERSGRIRVVDGNGLLLPTPFLNIDNLVAPTGGFSEKGLLGLAFHPDYANNGYFYVHYTDNNDDSQISRFSVKPDNPNEADPSTEKKILNVAQPYGNHNGGDLKFGPDGYLYIGFGDGGLFDDPGNRSQNPQELLGKMLRIDVDNGDPYAIPPDNPFVGNADVLDEIWSIGLRNPWRFSFDKVTGDMWIGDVGQDAFAEVDMEPAGIAGGLNYGWRCYEGLQEYITGGCGPASDFTPPVHVYAHGSNGCSITGGYVYRGVRYTDLYGKYIYGDFCSGKIWALSQNTAGEWENELIHEVSNGSWTTFGEDVNGELFVMGLNNGTLYRTETEKPALPPTIEIVGMNLNSIEGDFAPYTAYQWWLDGAPLAGATATTLDNPVDGLYQLEVTTPQGGKMYSNELVVMLSSVENLKENYIRTFPNPFTDNITIEARSASSNMILSLRNIEGKLLRTWENKSADLWKTQLDLSDLTPGVYNLEFDSGTGIITKRIVKQ